MSEWRGDGERRLPVERFGFRLSARDPEDVVLAELLAEVRDRGDINLSKVIKRLMLAFLMEARRSGRYIVPMVGEINLISDAGGGGVTRREVEEFGSMEDPNDPLVKSLIGFQVDAGNYGGSQSR